MFILSMSKNTPFIAHHFLRMASLQNLSIAYYCCVFAPSTSQKLSHSKRGILKRERYTKKLSLWLLLICFCPLIYAQTTIKILQLRHRTAEEIAQILRPLLDTHETVIADGFQLIVKADPQQLDEIEQLIKSLDKKQHRLIITVAQGNESSLKQLDAGIKVRINSFKNNRISKNSSIGGHFYQSTSSETDKNIQFIQTLEGQAAHIQFGEHRPYSENYISVDGNVVISTPQTRFRDVTSGFTVTPTLAKDSVRLKIAPWSNKLSRQGDSGVVKTRGATTTISAALGEWIRLGGQIDSQSYRENSLLSTRRSTEKARGNIHVRVDDLDGE